IFLVLGARFLGGALSGGAATRVRLREAFAAADNGARRSATSEVMVTGVRSSWYSWSSRIIGAYSHAPRHSTSSYEKSPSFETSPASRTPIALLTCSTISLEPRSEQLRLVHT